MPVARNAGSEMSPPPPAAASTNPARNTIAHRKATASGGSGSKESKSMASLSVVILGVPTGCSVWQVAACRRVATCQQAAKSRRCYNLPCLCRNESASVLADRLIVRAKVPVSGVRGTGGRGPGCRRAGKTVSLRLQIARVRSPDVVLRTPAAYVTHSLQLYLSCFSLL